MAGTIIAMAWLIDPLVGAIATCVALTGFGVLLVHRIMAHFGVLK